MLHWIRFYDLYRLWKQSIIMFLIAIIPWGYDKKLGMFIGIIIIFLFDQQFFKAHGLCLPSVVVDSRLHPYEGAVESATGYCFQTDMSHPRQYCLYDPSSGQTSPEGLQFLFIFCMLLRAFIHCYISVHFLTDIIGLG